jgi:Skp family chaperone for outer membrane proteins
MKDFIHKHPKMSYLIVGIIVGLIMSGITMYQADKSVRVITETLQKVKSESKVYKEESTRTVNSLTTENKKLKSKTTTYKVIKPDGTIEERTSSETESEESMSEAVKEEYEQRIMERIKKSESEFASRIDKLVKERKSMVISGGIDFNLNYYGAFSYEALPPFTIEAGAWNDGRFTFGIGWKI